MSKTRLDLGVPIVILAAGRGSRMKSAVPKVLQTLAGKPLIFHLLNQIKKLHKSTKIGLVIGVGGEMIRSYLKQEESFWDFEIEFILQKNPQGTGHALQCVLNSDWGQKRVKTNSPLLVLPGDFPLIPSQLLLRMIEKLPEGAAARVLTCELPEPHGYGRVIREQSTRALLRIIEEKDANPSQKQIKEVAHSIYLFQSRFLNKHLPLLNKKNTQGEYYLTDMIELASSHLQKVEELLWNKPEDLPGVNNKWELAQAARILNQRILEKWALEKGVFFQDPQTTWVDWEVQFEEDVRVDPGVILRGETLIGAGSSLGPNVILKNVKLGEGVEIQAGTVAEGAEIGKNASIGPFARLRPGTQIGARARVGNFVELKACEIGEDSKVSHLSYLGDAKLGKRVNVGCGFITCNYDGKKKHPTWIGDDVFIGSDCQVIAPIQLGEGSFIAAGSTITEDVEKGAMAIARSRQVNKKGRGRKP